MLVDFRVHIRHLEDKFFPLSDDLFARQHELRNSMRQMLVQWLTQCKSGPKIACTNFSW